MVSLASVTLGDDCGGSLPAPARSKADAEADDQDRHGDSDDMVDRGCTQTSMQVSITTHPRLAKATRIKIKKVELLDDRGRRLETLVATRPSTWTGKAYTPWNEAVSANQRLVTSYVLSTPSWHKLGGRRTAHTRKFQVRVTVAVGTKDRTIEKQATTVAYMEPDVDT